jgi:NADPH-dependent ferric siderophore reductase
VWKARKAAVPAIIDILEAIDPQFTGELPLASLEIRDAVARLNISRGDFVGACFYVWAGGPFGDPIVDLVVRNSQKAT